MSEKGLFLQNVIAVIWDFDKTLAPRYMQRPLFEEYGIDEQAFWEEVRGLPAYYERAGIHVQRDTSYLGHLLSYVRHGKLAGLTNAKLRELGSRIELYPGMPEFMARLTDIVKTPEYEQGDLHLEHYVVSTGLAEMIRGSALAEQLTGIWASEFVEEPAGPETDLAGAPVEGPISQIATFLDNTTKTRALFEINKGVNKERSITVNTAVPEDDRRVPFKNMIYVADGPSDIPSFSVVKKHGGLAFAVYDPKSTQQFDQAMMLHETGRVEMTGPADYSQGSPTDMWFQRQIRKIADRMMAERRHALASRVKQEPEHISDKEEKENSGS